MRFRFSILNLIVFVAVIAVGFAALRNPSSQVWASVLFTVAAFVLLTATLGSLLNRRATWIGFSLFGWAFLAICFGSLVAGEWISTADRNPIPMPIVTITSVHLHFLAFGHINSSGGSPAAVIPNFHGGHTLVSYSLLQMCNSLVSLLAACLGGFVARIFAARDDRPQPRP